MLKLELGDPLSNDEHTAAESAYARLLKARKWLYVVGLVALLHAHDALSYRSLGTLSSGLLAVPTALAQSALVVSLAPLLAQYILLLVQLGASYRVIISERMLKRMREAFAKAGREIEVAEAHVRSTATTLAAEVAQLADLEEQLEVARGALLHQERLIAQGKALPSVPKGRDLNYSPAKPQEDEVSRLETEVISQSLHNGAREDELKAAEDTLAKVRENYGVLRRNTPEANPWFVRAEYALDAIRIGLPLIVAVYALAALLMGSIVGIAEAPIPPPAPADPPPTSPPPEP